MSLRTGKEGYNIGEEFRTRTEKELRARDEIFLRDTRPPEHEVAWVRYQLLGHRRVLEIGCGLGIWGPVAVKAGCDYTGMDIVPRRVEWAKSQFESPNCRYILHSCCGNLSDVEPPLGKFDFILSVTVLQHMILPDAIAALRNIAALLDEDGCACLIESRLMELSEEECEVLYADPTCSPHMIPKPLGVLREAVPELEWWHLGADKFVLMLESR